MTEPIKPGDWVRLGAHHVLKRGKVIAVNGSGKAWVNWYRTQLIGCLMIPGLIETEVVIDQTCHPVSRLVVLDEV